MKGKGDTPFHIVKTTDNSKTTNAASLCFPSSIHTPSQNSRSLLQSARHAASSTHTNNELQHPLDRCPTLSRILAQPRRNGRAPPDSSRVRHSRKRWPD